jgi:hypothetical protein
MPFGKGILYCGKNEILETNFVNGYIPLECNIKIILSDGSYYEGGY